ncbi:hypothetical protein SCHIN_v1c09960 [Spiroplasma chinense]|uniref:Uncharacterized protein n=1 Tax=Spiroplasma chinense TaxID=216932 RepID=A0A5B9Y665_9MOLU|nr:hypothetical protein [Spiroplasma chinense]QEH62189.1 hypothetical protein SCHIN_v1c09960 [Spiroplasma chinense]
MKKLMKLLLATSSFAGIIPTASTSINQMVTNSKLNLANTYKTNEKSVEENGEVYRYSIDWEPGVNIKLPCEQYFKKLLVNTKEHYAFTMEDEILISPKQFGFNDQQEYFDYSKIEMDFEFAMNRANFNDSRITNNHNVVLEESNFSLTLEEKEVYKKVSHTYTFESPWVNGVIKNSVTLEITRETGENRGLRIKSYAIEEGFRDQGYIGRSEWVQNFTLSGGLNLTKSRSSFKTQQKNFDEKDYYFLGTQVFDYDQSTLINYKGVAETLMHDLPEFEGLKTDVINAFLREQGPEKANNETMMFFEVYLGASNYAYYKAKVVWDITNPYPPQFRYFGQKKNIEGVMEFLSENLDKVFPIRKNSIVVEWNAKQILEALDTYNAGVYMAYFEVTATSITGEDFKINIGIDPLHSVSPNDNMTLEDVTFEYIKDAVNKPGECTILESEFDETLDYKYFDLDITLDDISLEHGQGEIFYIKNYEDFVGLEIENTSNLEVIDFGDGRYWIEMKGWGIAQVTFNAINAKQKNIITINNSSVTPFEFDQNLITQDKGMDYEYKFDHIDPLDEIIIVNDQRNLDIQLIGDVLKVKGKNLGTFQFKIYSTITSQAQDVQIDVVETKEAPEIINQFYIFKKGDNSEINVGNHDAINEEKLQIYGEDIRPVYYAGRIMLNTKVVGEFKLNVKYGSNFNKDIKILVKEDINRTKEEIDDPSIELDLRSYSVVGDISQYNYKVLENKVFIHLKPGQTIDYLDVFGNEYIKTYKNGDDEDNGNGDNENGGNENGGNENGGNENENGGNSNNNEDNEGSVETQKTKATKTWLIAAITAPLVLCSSILGFIFIKRRKK